MLKLIRLDTSRAILDEAVARAVSCRENELSQICAVLAVANVWRWAPGPAAMMLRYVPTAETIDRPDQPILVDP